MTKQAIRKQAIAEIFSKTNLNDLGFKYLKSKNGYKREFNGLTYSIGFGSTRNNSLENTNIIIARTGVYDKKFAIWQQEKLGKRSGGRIGGGQIKNLFVDGPPYYDFDLTENKEVQQSVIEEICTVIKSDVLNFFEICSSTENIIANIHLPCFSIWCVIEYLTFIGQEHKINEVLDVYSKNYPTLMQEIKHYTNLVSEQGIENNFRETYHNETKRIALQIANSLTLINKAKNG